MASLKYRYKEVYQGNQAQKEKDRKLALAAFDNFRNKENKFVDFYYDTGLDYNWSYLPDNVLHAVNTIWELSSFSGNKGDAAYFIYHNNLENKSEEEIVILYKLSIER